jgi:glycogen debranching enzyme
MDGTEAGRRPYLHAMIVAVQAPAVALSPADGQVRGPGAGWYVADRRVLSGLVVTVDGVEPVAVVGQSAGAAHARFVGVVRGLGNPGADPTVFVERDRSVTGTTVREVVTVVSRARDPVTGTIGISLACDLATIFDVNSGRARPPLAAEVGPTSTRWRGADGVTALAVYSPAADEVAADAQLRWAVTLEQHQSWSVALEVTVAEDPDPLVMLPVLGDPAFSSPVVRSGDRRLTELVEQSATDLTGLLVADAADPRDVTFAAGAPWYLSLFGRDSLWTARLTLPLGTTTAGGTLRALARRQGTRRDAESAQAPGKILHELRRGPVEVDLSGRAGHAIVLPPVYYGSVDATPLWISLLHDAWRWGLPADEVEALLPALDGALGWLRDDAVGEDGFVRYLDPTGRGLANQGWKDSLEAVQFADGRLATGPIALCEAQAYAHAAAVHAADLLDAFGRRGADGWREWAAALRDRFRERFWVDDVHGRFPAIALDRDGRPVDTVTSNLGHLLGTGLLDAEETAAVVDRLGAPDLASGFGLRTMSARETGYNPLSYHCGSVWPHDTAIAIAGLAASPGPAAATAARRLIDGLLAASPAFGGRLPELYGGQPAANGHRPVPYPASCRPQAWSAAAGLVVVSAILGLAADVPHGVLRVSPMRPSPVGELSVHGLRVAGEPLDLHVTAAGDAEVLTAPTGLRLELPIVQL